MKRKVNNRGFTLIEILAAMVLLSIVAFPLINTFLDSFKFQARSQIKTEANKVIEYVTEQLKNQKYTELGITNIEEWVGLADAEPINIEVNSLPETFANGRLTAKYDVQIDRNSKKEVQEGGVGTPSDYELRMTLTLGDDDSVEAFIGTNEFIGATYNTNIFNISSKIQGPLNGENYAILIDNQTGRPITINVKKQIEDKVTIYTKGEITLREVADPLLSREKKKFEKVKLGNKNEIKDEKEYLCEATITATNSYDDAIYSSMNVTFSVFVENEG